MAGKLLAAITFASRKIPPLLRRSLLFSCRSAGKRECDRRNNNTRVPLPLPPPAHHDVVARNIVLSFPTTRAPRTSLVQRRKFGERRVRKSQQLRDLNDKILRTTYGGVCCILEFFARQFNNCSAAIRRSSLGSRASAGILCCSE